MVRPPRQIEDVATAGYDHITGLRKPAAKLNSQADICAGPWSVRNVSVARRAAVTTKGAMPAQSPTPDAGVGLNAAKVALADIAG